MKRTLVLLLLFLSMGCTTVRPPDRAPVHVVIVGTTDVHGWFNGRVEAPAGGGEGVVQGGLPALAAYVDALRAEHGERVIVVDSGDMFQGTLESNMFEGEAMVRGYNEIGYAAAAVGNHEFDFGPIGPDAIAREPGADPLGALKKNAALARFPLLSANMIDRFSGEIPSWAKRSTIVETGGARIGIIGLSTPDTPNVTMSLNVAGLEFTDPSVATLSAAAELRRQGVDAIVVIAHMGGRCATLDDPRKPESCETQQEANELLAKLPPGTIDAFFAGHTHARMRHYIHGVPALQAAPTSREFSSLDLWIDVDGDRVVKSELRPHTMICTLVYEGTESCDPRGAPAGAKLVPRSFAGTTIVPDVAVAAILEPYNRRVASKRDERLGIRAAAGFVRSHTAEAPLANLIADALREGAESDFAMMNSGGVRADLRAGDLVYGDIFSVSPFDNYPAVVSLSRDEIVELLRLTSGSGRGLMQVSGLRYTLEVSKDEEKPSAGRDRILSVTLADGTPLQGDRLYTVAMPDFIAAGGDGALPLVSKLPRNRIAISYLKPIRDVLIDVLKKRPQPLTPRVDGRITIVKAPAQ